MKIVKNVELTTTLTGWLSKLITIFSSFISTKLIIDLCGIEGYAIQVFILNLVPWFSLLNIGLPSSLHNYICYSKNDYDNKNNYLVIAKTFSLILFITATLLSLIAAVILDNTILFHGLDYKSIFLISICIFTYGLLEIKFKILFSIGKGYIANIIPAITSLATVLIIYYMYRNNYNNLNYVLTLFYLPTLISYVFLYYILFKQNHICINQICKSSMLIKKSIGFLSFTLLGNITLKIDIFIINYFLDQNNLATYGLIQKYFLTILFLYSVILNSFWPKVAELYCERKYNEIKNKIKKLIIYGTILVLSLSIIFICYNKYYFKFFSFSDASYTLSTIILAIIYCNIRIITDAFTTIILASNQIKYLNYQFAFQPVLCVISQIYFVSLYQIDGIFYGLIFTFLFSSLWYCPFIVYKKLLIND